MQDAKVLNQRDIARLRNAVDRLVEIGNALMGKPTKPPVKVEKKVVKRRRRRTKAEMAAAAETPDE